MRIRAEVFEFELIFPGLLVALQIDLTSCDESATAFAFGVHDDFHNSKRIVRAAISTADFSDSLPAFKDSHDPCISVGHLRLANYQQVSPHLARCRKAAKIKILDFLKHSLLITFSQNSQVAIRLFVRRIAADTEVEPRRKSATIHRINCSGVDLLEL